MQKLLYVDDEILNLELFKVNYSDEYDVFTSESAREGLAILAREEINVVITDFKMPNMNGVEFIDFIKSQTPNKVCMLLTAYMDVNEVKNAIEMGKVFKCILKPWKKADLSNSIDEAFKSIL